MYGGECVSPVEDGPLLVAFASAHAGVDAARELAVRFDARVAAATGQAEPRAGRFVGASASAAAQLLKMADQGSVLIDDPTVSTLDGQLGPEVGFAIRSIDGPAGLERRRAWPVGPGTSA